MLNYYRRVIPHAAKFQAPFIDAVVPTKSKGPKPFSWALALHDAFVTCKNNLFTDASSAHVRSYL